MQNMLLRNHKQDVRIVLDNDIIRQTIFHIPPIKYTRREECKRGDMSLDTHVCGTAHSSLLYITVRVT